MTSLGHKLTGLCAGIFVLSVMPSMGLLNGSMLFFACIFGATAPDWLEIAWTGWDGKRKSIIPHRKITHWIPLWILLLWYGIYHMSGTHAYLVIGFAVGGLTHLIVDIPNPMGVPLLHPWRNVSLNWWKSGEKEKRIILFFLIIDLMSFIDIKYYKALLP